MATSVSTGEKALKATIRLPQKNLQASIGCIERRREENIFMRHNTTVTGATRKNRSNLSRKRREEAGEACRANKPAMEQKRPAHEWHTLTDGH
ncbi:hypothetical protein CJ030_MR6G000258 [Morella rubra]|uniref:Uncharacterized protein n=1 Tax=Morella rubra TaxID=262757 RepID=A0A6A1VAL4_9ROSI|nr:hypothetical protein CJ030_MR6G000258 [Morella rubra]